MNRNVLSCLPIGVVASLFAALAVALPANAEPAGPAAPGTGQSGGALQSAVSAATQSVLVVHVPGTTRTLEAAIAGAQQHDAVDVRHRFISLHAFSVQVPAADAASQAARLRQLPGVASVENSVVRQFDGTATNDPDLSHQQPYLDAVRAPAAWSAQHGSSAIKIAVVDSGVDVGHPDLQGNDKIVGSYNAVTPGQPVTDEVGHGTFVAGVAAADTNNGVGVAGAGYDTGILAVKIASPDGTIAIDDEVAGIKWAADHGADIINLSLGGPDSSSAEKAAITYAQHKGVLIVAAAGNEADTVPQYPAAYPGVVAVGATDPVHHSRASFSSHGSWVTLAAPGVAVYSTVPRAGSEYWPKDQYPNEYAGGDGTSFSTPIVAGEAALLKAQNPSLSPSRLRAALVASAHGYSGRGLGAGQVDFALGLAHVAPTTIPSEVHVDGTAGRVRLVATSTAPKVAFKIGSDPMQAPVAVSGGQAASTFASWGYPNGTRTVYAYDCTAYGECNTKPRTATFTVANSAPTITSPAGGATVTGRFTVRVSNPAGGPLRLLADGKPIGSVAAAPYLFTYSASSMSDGDHALTAQGCSIDGRYCHGPASAPVGIRAAGLHPSLRISPEQFSPNADHVRDAATLTFKLADTETAHVTVRDSAGTVVRSHSLGTLGAGTHTWTWSGTHGDGTHVPDGTYAVALETSRGDRRGWVVRPVVVDVRAPRLTHPSGANSLFYPYRDGYRDTFTTRTTLSDAGTLTLTIRTTKGRLVRTITSARHSGPAAISWTGRYRSGIRVPAGTYSWKLTVTDAAGNSSHTAGYPVRVSHKRLVHRTVYVDKHGAGFDAARSTAACASARTRTSVYDGGLRLVDGCPASAFDLALAQYTFTVPKMISYSTLSLQVLGRSTHLPSELLAAFQAGDGTQEIPGQLKISTTRHTWRTIASVPAAGHVTAWRHVHASVILDGFYPGVNNFDIDHVRLRASVVELG